MAARSEELHRGDLTHGIGRAPQGLGPIILSFSGHVPQIDSTAWIAPGAAVVGDVDVGSESSIWYGAVVRGDVHCIRIGRRTNIQDQATVHVTRDRFSTLIGDEVTVGHRAVVHGCTIHPGALIGIGAVVLDGAEVGEGALVAAGAVVTPGSKVPAGQLAVGVPAQVVRRLSDDERSLQIERTLGYVELAQQHAREPAMGVRMGVPISEPGDGSS